MLTTSAYDAAREAAPGWDIYHLESRWREHFGGTSVTAPDKAFVGFCRKFTKGKAPS